MDNDNYLLYAVDITKRNHIRNFLNPFCNISCNSSIVLCIFLCLDYKLPFLEHTLYGLFMTRCSAMRWQMAYLLFQSF
jgi:hypothetical protein